MAPPEMRTQRGRRRSDHYKLPQLRKSCIVNKELGLRGDLYEDAIGPTDGFRDRQGPPVPVPTDKRLHGAGESV